MLHLLKYYQEFLMEINWKTVICSFFLTCSFGGFQYEPTVRGLVRQFVITYNILFPCYVANGVRTTSSLQEVSPNIYKGSPTFQSLPDQSIYLL